MENTFDHKTIVDEQDGFEFLGIRFVPLFEPFHRRWETFCVAYTMTMGVFLQILTPFLMYYLFRFYPWIFFAYIIWMIYDWNTPVRGGRPNAFVRRLCSSIRNYFPSKIVKTAEITPDRNYLFAAFPHGILSTGILSNFVIDVNSVETFPGIEPRVIMLKAFFAFPFTREYLLCGGASASTEENMLGLLRSEKKNQAVILMVGGALESLYANPGKIKKVILEHRKGFIRLALKAGSPIVPLYTFGENEVYKQIQNESILKFQNTVRKWTGIPPVLAYGRGLFQYSFGLIPHRVPLNTVVGKPIVVPQIDNPSKEDIEKYHAIFKKDLIELFDAHKGKYDPCGQDAELIVL